MEEENELPEVFVTSMRKNLDMPLDILQDAATRYLEKHPDYEKYGALRLLAKAETGHGSWYSWALRNWGTKWNAYDFNSVTPRSKVRTVAAIALESGDSRRTRVAGEFPDGRSALIPVCARARYVTNSHWGTTRYMSMKHVDDITTGEVAYIAG